MSSDSGAEMNTELLRGICGGISRDRARELLEAANGNLERAVDIFFHQQQQDQSTQEAEVTTLSTTPTTTPTKTGSNTGERSSQRNQPQNAKKRGSGTSPSQTPSKKDSKQARLDFFFASPSGKTRNADEKSSSNVREIVRPSETNDPKGEPTEIIALDDEDEGDHQITNSHPRPVGGSTVGVRSGNSVVADADITATTNVKHHKSNKSMNHACSERSGGEGEISFQRLAETLQQLSDTTKRLVKLDALQQFFQPLITGRTKENHDATSYTLTCALHLILGFRGMSSSSSSAETKEIESTTMHGTKGATNGGGGDANSSGGSSGPLEIGGAAMSKALQTVLGASRMQLSKAYRQYGDMGDAAASLFQKKSFFVVSSNKDSGLSIRRVYESFERISKADGRDAKQHILLQLLRSCDTKTEVRFLVRLLIGNMRVGANLKTVLAALAMALLASVPSSPEMVPESCDLDKESEKKRKKARKEKEDREKNRIKEAVELVQKTHDICPDLRKIIDALLKGGLEQMRKDCGIQLLTPIAPMLAHPIHSLEQVAKAMDVEGMHASNDSSNEYHRFDGGISERDEPQAVTQKAMTMEWKYDGVRCQAHFDGSKIKLFSRHMLETTEQYPDAAQAILEAATSILRLDRPTVSSFILDAEIVGVEGGDDCVDSDEACQVPLRLLPFQDLSRRKKKQTMVDGKAGQIETGTGEKGVRVKVFAFDLMYLNGVSYIHQPLFKRQQALYDHFFETRDFAFVSSQPLSTFDEASIRAFLEDAVQNGAEGLMLKMLGVTDPDQSMQMKDSSVKYSAANTTAVKTSKELLSLYEAGTRSHSWLKVKRDYVSGYADTIDVVPIGAWFGHGRKAQKSFLSPVLLAVYDEEEDVYRSISRCMSFTDAMYDAMREYYFRGTPYPKHLGVGESNSGVVDPSDDSKNCILETAIEDDEKNIGIGDSDHDQSKNVQTYQQQENGMVDGASLVNCFPSRPSSAYVVTNESPPIWFKPLEVFEVSFADMSLSRQHTAGAGLVDDPDGRGIALRFPRFKRRRPDKKPEQATSSLQIARMFGQQSKQGGTYRRNTN